MTNDFSLIRARRTLLLGTSAVTIMMAAAVGANAQCAPDPTLAGGVTNCTGTDTDGLAVTTPNTTVNVVAGAVVSASSSPALKIEAPASFSANTETVNISGQVQGSGTAGIALYNGSPTGSVFGTTANLALTVAAGGSVSGTSAVILTQSTGNTSSTAIARIDNSGTLSGTSGIALLVNNPALGGFASITNRSGGTIGAISGPVGIVSNAGTIDGGANSAIDVGTGYNAYIGSGSWTNSGTITSAASTATLRNVTASITNSGTIANTGTGSAMSGGSLTITNSGTIGVTGSEAAISGTQITVVNSGTIRNTGAGAAISGNQLTITNQAGGNISASGSPALSATYQLTLTNAGTITGDVVATTPPGYYSLSVIDSSAGTITGNVTMGTGDDVVVARYTGTPTLITGISGTIDAGTGTNSIRIKATQDTVINTAIQLPTGFQRLQIAPASGATVTLADGFVAPATLAFVGDTLAGAGSVVNQTALTFSGQAITSQTYSGAASFTNQGSIRSTGGSNGTAALALDGVTTFINNGLIDVAGRGVQTSVNGTTTNNGTIIATGTAITAFDNYFDNRGTVRSTGGTAVALSGNVGNRATNSGTIEGAVTGVATGIDLTNTGTIVATSSTGTAVALDAYGSLINAAGGVVGNGNGSAAVTASIFNSTVYNAGTINGSVSLAGVFSGANQRYIALPGGILNGNLTLGAGSLLVTDIVNTGPGAFAGITGTVTAGDGSALRYRVGSDTSAAFGPVGPFQTVGYELAGGATLSLSATATRTQSLQLAGTGTVNLNANISTTSAPAIQSVATTYYPGAPTSTGSALTINSSGNIGFVRAANTYLAGVVSLGTKDSFTSSGTITVVDRQSISASIAAVSTGKLVTNGGSILLDNAIGISGAATVVNTGTISQAANGLTSQGIVNALIVDNRGTISVGGPAVQLGYSYNFGSDYYATLPSLTNSGTIVSTTGVAVASASATRLDNSGTISGGMGTAVQLGFGDDIVTLRTGSKVVGAIVGGGGTDAAILAGTQGTATQSQTVAAFNGFSTLTVASGYWTASAGSSFARGVTIAQGAALEDANGATGLSGAIATTITNNGTLVVRSSGASAGPTFGTTRITGSGAVLLTGSGTVLLDGMGNLAHSGGTTIADGTTAILTGTQGGPFATASGGTFQIGNGGTTGSFTGDLVDNGTLLLNRTDDYTLAGAISGSGVITKLGAGKVTLAGAYSFTGVTNIQAGSIKLATAAAANSQLSLEGSGQLDLSGLNQTVAALSGTSAAASANIAGGSLIVNQAGDTSFAGTIAGNGSFTKSGAGRLNFTGNQTYSGATTVSGGTLSVNGTLMSPITVANGGTLGGVGTVGSVMVAAGGTYAPGNSIGTQTITGNLTFAPGSIYLVEVNPAGQADRLNVGGTAALAGTVMVRANASGTYANLTSYQILTATGGISGKFDSVSTDLAYLTPSLLYAANGVSLRLVRNDVSFSAIAANHNQASVANAIERLRLGNTLYDAVFGLSAQGARTAFATLTGEIHASLPTSLLLQSQQVAHVASSHANADGDGIHIWGQGLYDRIEGRTTGGLAPSLTDQTGGITGIDLGRDGLRAGLAAGYVDGDLGLVGLSSHADIHSKLALAYASWAHDALRFDATASYTWHTIRSRRSVDLGSLGGTQSAHYKANVVQVAGKASYAVAIGNASIAPFVGLSYLRVHRDGFSETGTSVALTVAQSNRNIEAATAGILLSGEIPLSSTSLLPRVALSYQRNWGNISGIEHATLGSSGSSFGIVGTGLGKGAVRVEGGTEWRLTNAFRLGADLFGEAGGGYGQYGARGSITFQF